MHLRNVGKSSKEIKKLPEEFEVCPYVVEYEIITRHDSILSNSYEVHALNVNEAIKTANVKALDSWKTSSSVVTCIAVWNRRCPDDYWFLEDKCDMLGVLFQLKIMKDRESNPDAVYYKLKAVWDQAAKEADKAKAERMAIKICDEYCKEKYTDSESKKRRSYGLRKRYNIRKYKRLKQGL